MQIRQTNHFENVYKKLHANQIVDVDNAIREVVKNPYIGTEKKGDLAGVFVYKFKMVKQLTLLAYTFDKGEIILTLLDLGSHENFYRDLKKRI